MVRMARRDIDEVKTAANQLKVTAKFYEVRAPDPGRKDKPLHDPGRT
jgi:hypothetical protein